MGDPLRIAVSGLPPDREVAVDVTVRDARDLRFEASFPAVADEEGTAVATPPDDGGRDGPFAAIRTEASSSERVTAGLDAAGPPRMPLAELEPASEAASSRQFVANGSSRALSRVEVSASARVAGTSLDAATTRVLVADSVAEREVQSGDLVGWVYEPEVDGPRPGVLVLHGSSARVPRRYAGMLASSGFTVLALQYFGARGQPSTLDDVPLEYFQRAASYLLGRRGVARGGIGFVGISRGVEAALLAAAALDGTAVVVGHSGSGLVMPGIDEERGVAGYEAAWTRGGEPIVPAAPLRRLLPAIPAPPTDASALPAAVRELESYEATERAAVPVEEIDGPILLLSGQQDALWNGPALSEYAIQRLARNGHPHPFAHVTYDGTGHVFVEPYRYPGFVVGDQFGGTSAGYARAAADAYVRSLDYLRYGLDA